MPRKKKLGVAGDTKRKIQRMYELTWRDCGDGSDMPNTREWHTEEVEITGFIVNAAGALTLFNAGAPVRSMAPGFWADISLIGELGEVTEDAA